MLKIGSLCTGYGGLDMAVEAYFNAETVWTCEFDKHASKIIEERIGKPNYGDLKTTDWASVEPIDILTAGYPCQPFSHAGLRKGVEDERHLWPYIKEIIRQLQPSYVILENVRGHFGLGFREVLGDLTSIGYDAKWKLIRASDVGAPHRRERLFIFAYPTSARCTHSHTGDLQTRKSRVRGSNSNELANTSCQRCQNQLRTGKSNGTKQSYTNEYTHTHSERCSVGQDNCNEVQYQRQPQFVASGLVQTITTNSNSNTRTEPRGADSQLRAEGVGLRGGQDKGQTGAEFRFSLEMDKKAVPAPLDQGKLNVKFVEYMMGLPEGWVTDVDLPRSQMLKILGNGVVPQQAYRALQLLVNNL